MAKLDRALKRYLNEGPMDTPPAGGTAPAAGSPPPAGGAPGGAPMGGADPLGGGPDQQQGQVPNQLPGDPAGAMKFTQLMSQIAGPKGFLWTTYAKNKTLYPKLCGELAEQVKQLAELRNSIDLTLSNLSKAIVRTQQADQGEEVDGQ